MMRSSGAAYNSSCRTRDRRIAASSASALYHPTEKRMRRLDELPMEIHTAIEAVKCAPDGTIITVKFWNKLEALKFLARTQELAGAQEPMAVGPVTNVTSVFLADCTTDELKVLERILERHERRHALTTEYLNNKPLPEDTIDSKPVRWSDGLNHRTANGLVLEQGFDLRETPRPFLSETTGKHAVRDR
jgi:hypothetical protein